MENEQINKNRPNIVVIIVDAFRIKNSSLFGYEKETDKNLKKMASDSFVFKDFFSSSNATAPSLTTLFTGKYPVNHGIIHQFPYTKPEEIEEFERKKSFWLPTFLKDKGYRTIAIDWIGTWFKDGFDYYQEKEEQRSRLNRIMNVPLIKRIMLGLPNWAYSFGKKIVKTRSSANFSPAKYTMKLAINKMKESVNEEKPFFFFTHFWDTHFPFPTISYKGSGINNIDNFMERIKDKTQKEYFKKRITDIGLCNMEDIVGKYDAAISEVDKQIGNLLNFLKKNKLWDNTILMVFGDHGTSLTEHEVYFSSSSLYDDCVHVPFIAHFPKLNGGEIKGFVQNTDIAPTILDLIGENHSEHFDGESMLKVINGENARDKVFAFDGLAEDAKMIRTKNKKLIIAKNPRCNLCKSRHHENFEEYDLEKDPEEKNNIYSEKNELQEMLEKIN